MASRLRPPISSTTCTPTQPATRPDRAAQPDGSWMTASRARSWRRCRGPDRRTARSAPPPAGAGPAPRRAGRRRWRDVPAAAAARRGPRPRRPRRRSRGGPPPAGRARPGSGRHALGQPQPDTASSTSTPVARIVTPTAPARRRKAPHSGADLLHSNTQPQLHPPLAQRSGRVLAQLRINARQHLVGHRDQHHAHPLPGPPPGRRTRDPRYAARPARPPCRPQSGHP